MFTEIVKIYIDLLVEKNEYLERRMRMVEDTYSDMDSYDDMTYYDEKLCNKVRSVLLKSINEEIDKVDKKYCSLLVKLPKEELQKSVEKLQKDQRTLVVKKDQMDTYNHFYDLFIDDINDCLDTRKVMSLY